MASARDHQDLTIFEALRPELAGLSYRMLGDVGRAQDIVQEAWLRWHRRDVEVASPKAFLLTIVTRLCLNELDSARARREESRGDRLPEPVELSEAGLDRIETVEQVSMAFLVILERLTPTARAVFLLHDVFDFTHDEIAPLVSRSAAACRKLLERAREKVSAGRRLATATREEHERLLEGFLASVTTGDVRGLVGLLAHDAVLVTDGGAAGRRIGPRKNLQRPLEGSARVAAFLTAAARGIGLEVERRELNGRPGLVFYREGAPFAALQLAVSEGKVQHVFFHADLSRLGHLGPRTS
jgi:RNA polymerase sigma-70 factor (ECF subfamily)